MNDVLDPPAERDLPPGRAGAMRSALMGAARPPHARRAVRTRLAVALTAAVMLAAGAAVTSGRDDPGVEVLAMGPDEMSPTLRRAAQQCLIWYTTHQRDEIGVALRDLVVGAEQGHRAALLFITPAGYLTCEVVQDPDEELGGAVNGQPWPHRDWLPGHLERLLMTTSEHDGGATVITGRVTSRVARLVLEHGDGHTTEARLQHGVFGLLTGEPGITDGAALVAYDTDGQEIERRQLLVPRPSAVCYTDPAGAIIYGPPDGSGCQPAQPWGY